MTIIDQFCDSKRWRHMKKNSKLPYNTFSLIFKFVNIVFVILSFKVAQATVAIFFSLLQFFTQEAF